MTDNEVINFRSQFKSIVYQRSVISVTKQRLRDLNAWDKNGSHKDAILKELDKLDEGRGKLDQMLLGKPYEKWKEASAQISRIHSRMKRSDQVRRRAAIDLINFSF